MNVDAGIGADALAQAVVVDEITGEGRDPHYAPEEHGICANCETPLTGAYCHACGQSAHIHRSLLHMFEELLHGIFHFETKAWRTIPALIFTPGKLTRNYIAGQRTRYVSPLALFLFLIFLMFFVFSLTSSHYDVDNSGGKAETNASISKDLDAAKIKLQSLTAEREKLAKGDQKIESINQEINDTKIEIATLEVSLKAIGQLPEKNPEPNVSKDKKSKLSGTIDFSGDVNKGFDLALDDENVSSSTPWIKETLKHAAQNPELTLYKMKSAASKFAFLLMPISLPFLWLMFIFKRRYVMFDHAVFSLFSLSFMTILIMFVAILSKCNLSGVAAFFTMVVPPVHMFAQLRGSYALTKFEAFWRTIALLFIALISLIIYALIVVGISA
ncbi:DUF3667 domain-containing protein [Undibacterium sp. Dicai25W]|uniref:DUF3667 domain-containing protein n=1 Tax=Undibacterium sp. Dicai25W TaxID=3413034 RepID=UPI003BF3DF6F